MYIFKKFNSIKLRCKWHSLILHIVNFVKDSLLKNSEINIVILVDIYIEKWMVIGQLIFHREKKLGMKVVHSRNVFEK